MPPDCFRLRQTPSLLIAFIKIEDNAEMEQSGGIFKNEVFRGALYCCFVRETQLLPLHTCSAFRKSALELFGLVTVV